MCLCEEVKMLRNAVPENCASLNALICIISNKLSEIYPDMFIAAEVLPVTSVTVASAERSF
jgi:hypothetical protein